MEFQRNDIKNEDIMPLSIRLCLLLLLLAWNTNGLEWFLAYERSSAKQAIVLSVNET